MDMGPPVEQMVHRLGECPGDFLGEPRRNNRGSVHVDAVVADLLADLGMPLVRALDTVGPLFSEERPRNALRLVLVAAWLLRDPWFVDYGRAAPGAVGLFKKGLDGLAAVVAADLFVTDPERREELARVCLSALGLVPGGETRELAGDRLRSLDSIERERLLREAQEKRERARKLAKAMAAKKARESAAKASREW